jgi:hypothetical protein
MMKNRHKILVIFLLTGFLYSFGTLRLYSQDLNGAGNRVFIVYSTGEDQQEFKDYAKIMARLRPYGRVDICINAPAEKSEYEIPENSCDWHEYASYNRSVAAFFPDAKLVPFFPADFVAKNRQLLLYKAGVLRELGLSASFRSNEPRFLPEAFFEKYPDLRGPRVDHPRRSVQKEFAPCFHRPETIEMYRNMAEQLFANVPEIRTLYFSMNDAGSGFCWEDWLYSGPNGPSACRNINKSEAITTMLKVYKEGARKTGNDIDIYFKGMFTDAEIQDLAAKLPDKCFLEGSNTPPVRNISTMFAYPVRGIINPLNILRTLGKPEKSTTQTYVLSFQTSYSRGHERIEIIEKVVDMILENFKDPAGEGEINALVALRKLCTRWGGDENAEILYNAFQLFDQAINRNNNTLRGMDPLYWAVSARHITRPLVYAPQLLTAKEEKSFLPYVFNISTEEARNDYMDIHGGNRELPMNAVDNLTGDLKRVSSLIERIKNAPEQKFLDNLARAIRIYACVVSTCGNFNDAQIIRNRNRDLLARPDHRPNKIPTWTGDQDLLDFNEIMRKELDNTQDLVNLLESGGRDLVYTARPPFPEDTFVLGPDIINQLKTKRKIMLAHWIDIEGYLVTPFK